MKMPFQPGDRVVIARINVDRVSRDRPLLFAAIGRTGTIVRAFSTESDGYYVRVDGEATSRCAYDEELELA